MKASFECFFSGNVQLDHRMNFFPLLGVSAALTLDLKAADKINFEIRF